SSYLALPAEQHSFRVQQQCLSLPIGQLFPWTVLYFLVCVCVFCFCFNKKLQEILLSPPFLQKSVFYEDTLGNYPYFVDIDTPINGGLPQHTRLETHLQKMKQDLEEALPAPRYLGLGVLRWGEWVPQWSRSREKQALYVEASKKLLKAQSVMMETLREVKRLRPKALWGFSPYPSCYNSDPTQTMLANYTGQCPPAEMALNDELSWLWKRSSALYPLLTLEKLQVSNFSTCIHCIDLSWLNLLHIFFVFLLQADLVSSVGESAAMGTAGVVVWERSETKTEVHTFVRKVLGPYSINVTTAARLCSASLCQGRGRCVRQNPESSAYLHLPPPSTVAEKVRKYYLKLQLPCFDVFRGVCYPPARQLAGSSRVTDAAENGTTPGTSFSDHRGVSLLGLNVIYKSLRQPKNVIVGLFSVFCLFVSKSVWLRLKLLD
uniref:Hyaluronidase n=1 Tax=Maylandia zebra TaxID=106582 RepID=A0A3P9D1C2_9CICH